MFAGTARHNQRVRFIRRMYREDEEFRLTWDDYLLARKAWRHFRFQGNRELVEEYAQLCAELAQEVRGYIDERK